MILETTKITLLIMIVGLLGLTNYTLKNKKTTIVVNPPGHVTELPTTPILEWTKGYNKGFNDALDSIALINLEFNVLKSEPKTFGEMADICRERHGIEKE